MKTDNNIPYDLKKYLRNYVLKRVFACIIMLILLGTALALLIDIIFPPKLVSFKILFRIVVMAVPFILTGVPFKLIDHTYYGTIEKVLVDSRVDNASSVKPTREGLYWKHTVHLTVRTASGKTINQQASYTTPETASDLNKYKEGDKVFHLYGSRQIVILPESADTVVECAVCGSLNNIENEKCRNCGHSLVK